MRIEYHRTLIADQVRNETFRSALAASIEPGVTTVADIGAGTGLIGLMAARLGAREVFLYETAEVAGVAARILKANRARNCSLFPCHSTAMQDPPPVDLVVSETLGNYPLEEDILATLEDARRRFLKPGGRMIPSQITQLVAPVVAERFHGELLAWDRTGASLGLDLAPAKLMSLNNIYVRLLEPADLLDGMGSAKAWDRIDLSRSEKPVRRGEAVWRLSHAATIYGFATWWEAELSPGITLSTAPNAPRTHWEQLYFPLLAPIAGHRDETLTVSIRSRTSPDAGTHLAWTAGLLDQAGRQTTRQALDLDKGYLP